MQMFTAVLGDSGSIGTLSDIQWKGISLLGTPRREITCPMSGSVCGFLALMPHNAAILRTQEKSPLGLLAGR